MNIRHRRSSVLHEYHDDHAAVIILTAVYVMDIIVSEHASDSLNAEHAYNARSIQSSYIHYMWRMCYGIDIFH